MRKYTLTQNDHAAIASLRRRVEHTLTLEFYGFIPLDEAKHIRNVCSNRELQAILEYVRAQIPSSDMPFERRTIILARLRHGQPGWRGKDNMQPDFSELPTIEL